MPARVVVHLHVVISKAALLIGQCAIDQLFQLFNAQRFKSENLRTRHERAVHIKERIVRGRADKAEIATLNIGQKNVLLCLVKVVDLINEQDRPLSRSAEAIRRRGDYSAHFGDVAFHAADSNEFRVRHLRDDPRVALRLFRRPGEDHRRQTIRFNRASQKFAGSKDVFLTDKFIERARADARGERCSACCRFDVFLFLEQIVHAQKYGLALSLHLISRRA